MNIIILTKSPEATWFRKTIPKAEREFGNRGSKLFVPIVISLR